MWCSLNAVAGPGDHAPARDHELSWPTVEAAFTAQAEAALPARTPPVAHLGIEETRRGKAKVRLVAGPDGLTCGRSWLGWHVGFGRKGNLEWELRNRLTRASSTMHANHLNPMATTSGHCRNGSASRS